MPVTLTVLLFAIAGYFLAAAIVRQIRPRWGVAIGSSITFSRQGVERSKFKHTKPRMGAVSCLGFATFVVGFPIGGLASKVPIVYLVAAGFVLITVGAALDWLREPPKYTKR